jgi:hypothetical protein
MTLAHVITGGGVPSGVGGGRRQVELDVVSGATAVDVAAGDLHGSLYQVTTPATANGAPVATVDGDLITVSLASTRQTGPSSLHILLSAQADWRIRLDGGATEESVNLANAQLAALDFGAGSGHIDATLPPPVGTVPVTMSGGASSYRLHLPGGVPARVSFFGGAHSATVDGTNKSGIAGGTVVDTHDWPTSVNRYDIDNQAGVSTMTVDRA